MLVLMRKSNESIIIGDNITVTVLGIEGDKVKIGISAPREIQILRHELFQAVQEQNIIQAHLASEPEPKSFQSLRDLLVSEASPDPVEPEPPASQPNPPTP
jgi:carbon storage regulator